MSLPAVFDPILRTWFAETFGAPTQVQAEAWPRIAAGDDVLLTAPTGSGKTLAAMLWALDRLLTGAWSAGAVRVIYVSPMKALGVDVRRNLSEPLAALQERFRADGRSLPPISIATRSGDTDPRERARQLRQPPAVLVTTPETLNLLLASRSWVEQLDGVRAVIIDEVHQIADDRRGTWLMAGVEWLHERVTAAGGHLQRIALSATVEPMAAVAQLVAGCSDQGQPRPITLVVGDDPRQIELAIAPVPQVEPAVREADPDAFWRQLSPILQERIAQTTATIVFTGSRALAERLTRFLNSAAAERIAYPHHGSLSRELRTAVEDRLKRGAIPAVVATTSLELGIDIGDCQQVLMVQTPGTVASLLQRVGRSGHQVGGTSRGTIHPIHAQDLLEAVVLRRLGLDRALEPLQVLEAPLDALLQIIVARCIAVAQDPTVLFRSVTRQWAYRRLRRELFDVVCELACGRHAGGPLADVRPLLDRDPATGFLQARDGGARTFFTNSGMIPDRGLFQLRVRDDGRLLGDLDEEFVWERKIGDRFTLGSGHWRIVGITADRVEVVPAPSGDVMAPFWKNDQLDRGWHVGRALGEFCGEWSDAVKQLGAPSEEERALRPRERAVRDRLAERCDLDEAAADQLLTHLRRQAAATGGLPHRHRAVCEISRDVGGGQQLLALHLPWGRRLLRALALVIEVGWQERFGTACACDVGDFCLLIQVPHRPSPDDLRSLCDPDVLDQRLRQGLEGAGIFGVQFRQVAGRFLLFPKRHPNKRRPLWLIRQRAKELLGRCAERPDFPPVLETWRSCLHDRFDLGDLRDRLAELRDGTIAFETVETDRPSPFCGPLAWRRVDRLMYDDDRPIDQRSASLGDDLWRTVIEDPDHRVPLDPGLVSDAVARLQRLAPGYEVGDTRDLLDHLHQLVVLPLDHWQRLRAMLDEPVPDDRVIVDAGRVARVDNVPRLLDAGVFSHERMTLLDGEPVPDINEAIGVLDPDHALQAVIADVLPWWGPVAPSELAELLGCSVADLQAPLAFLADGLRLVRGQLLVGDERELVGDATTYERLLRRQRSARRLQIEPQPLTSLPAWLADLHRIGQAADLEQTLDPLLGFPVSAELWESALIPVRWPAALAADLDEAVGDGPLCLLGTGERQCTLTFPEALPLFRPDLAAGGDPLPPGPGRWLIEDLPGDRDAIQAALWQACWQGRIACTGMRTLRQAIAGKWKAAPAVLPRRGFGSWNRRDDGGAWYRLPVPDTDIDAVAGYERQRERVRQLLRRYGILCKELLQHEVASCRWGRLLGTIRLMELAGEVVVGSFFTGIEGLQVADPAVVDHFTAGSWRQRGWWLVNACDPVAGSGLGLAELSAWPRRVPGNWCVCHDDQLVLIARRQGAALQVCDGERFTAALEPLRLLLRRPVQPLAKITVETIDDLPVLDSPRCDDLIAAGFRPAGETLILDRS